MIQTDTFAFFQSVARLQEVVQTRTNITETDIASALELAQLKIIYILL
jgi:hypothetical protein